MSKSTPKLTKQNIEKEKSSKETTALSKTKSKEAKENYKW